MKMVDNAPAYKEITFLSDSYTYGSNYHLPLDFNDSIRQMFVDDHRLLKVEIKNIKAKRNKICYELETVRIPIEVLR